MPIDADRIEKPVRKLRKFLRKSPRRPTSTQIHDLRTNSRRFETNVEALGLSDARNERKLLRDLAQVRKRAGKIRDMDVLTGYTLKMTHLDGEQDCLVQLLETLGIKRAKQVKKLRATIETVSPRLRRRLKRSASKLERTIEKAQARRGLSSDRAAEAMARAIELSEDLKTPPRLDKANLHPFRLKVKKLRYILQLADSSDQQKFVARLGEVKDAIGEWHDWEELIAIADSLDHGSDCKLLPALQSISEEKYKRALELTNHMREISLESKPAGRSRAGARKPAVLKPAVLAATSAMSA